ncbi:MAG: HD domain-containing protein [Candidatus Methanomethylophilaceae archaeon]|nr:exopolyphosphatase / guanosine-5-triphosphate,3-diphosphate pyrophosphatase [Candidatus Methanomethylophilaceae archaeon]
MVDSRTVGFIDVGTNSIHVLVTQFFTDSVGTPIFDDKESVRLGQNLFAEGYIDQDTIERTKLVIGRFVKIAKDMGAEEIFAFATCAAREAYNRNELLEAASESGIDLRIISGIEEARLVGLGVFGPYGPPDRCVDIDLGGGSTEINLSKGSEMLFLDSLMAGSVRFSYGLGIDQSGVVSKADYGRILSAVDKVAINTANRLREIGFDRAVGSSGTMINLAEMCAARRDGDCSYMTRKELSELMRDLCAMDEVHRRNVPRMNPGRSDIIIGGGAIAEELMYLFEVDKIFISERGLREGMQFDYLLGKGRKEFNLRRSSVMTLARRCGFNEKHALQVNTLTMQLFDSMKDLGLHSMDGEVRELLGYAAILHDIGEFISYNKHNSHSYTIISNSNMPGFSSTELEEMALMAKFHHKRFPGAGHKLLKGLPKQQVKNIRYCALMLRMADVLDRHRSSPVDSMRVLAVGDSVLIDLKSKEDLSMEVWKLEELSEPFMDVFGRELRICASGWGDVKI